ncbi:hypothetical protein CYMTET_36568 [Cymbomonas tetramitiformis]|uniref:Uncharacterized protein n=1 Tax=Cymbomonas tetramitiformis TaxID=36881 RepID=A0AAE0F740_9CHLO|nr:hypothetical protein CYMTET_36568 [Cymbomonas tetramitiformis]
MPDSIPKPAGEGAPCSVIPQHVGGALSGVDLQVYPGQNLDAQEKKLVLGENGSVVRLIKFYEYLILQMEEDSSVTFKRRSYYELFEDYVREQQQRPARTPRSYNDDRNPRGGKDKNGPRNTPNAPNAPRDAIGKGGKGGKGRGRGGVVLPHNRHAPRCKLRHRAPPSMRAPAGAGEAPALEPVAEKGHEPEDGEEEDDVT